MSEGKTSSTHHVNNPSNTGEEDSFSVEKRPKRQKTNEDGNKKSIGININSQDDNYHHPETHISKIWKHIRDLFGDDEKIHNFYSESTAFSCDGSRFAIGYCSENGTASVKVLDFKDGCWNVVGSICGIFIEEVEEFGYNIALSGNGNVLAIGSRLIDEKSLCSGKVSMYHYTEGGNWTLMGCILEGIQPGDCFGKSIAFSKDGNRIAIGAPGEGGHDGSVSIFDFDGTNWVPIGQIFSLEDDYDCFGTAVSFSENGNVIAIGAPDSDRGSIQIFRHSSFENAQPKTAQENEPWVQVGKKLNGEASYDLFGYFLSTNAIGDVVMVGAPGGKYIKVFHFDGNEWHQMGQKILGEIDLEGSITLSQNKNKIAVFPKNQDGLHVKMYEYDEGEWKTTEDTFEAPSSEYCFGSSVHLSSYGDRLSIVYIHINDGFLGIHDFE